MKKRTTLPAGLIGLALLTGCGQPGDETAAAPATAAPTGTASPAPPTGFRVPPEGFPTDPDTGRSLFAAHCAACHGADALGTDRGPPLIHRIYEPSHHSDLAFYRAIALGVHQHHWSFGDMAAVPDVSGEDAAHIIAWIRREQRAAGIE
jgi:mono/diheme cytochrome c family protein